MANVRFFGQEKEASQPPWTAQQRRLLGDDEIQRILGAPYHKYLEPPRIMRKTLLTKDRKVIESDPEDDSSSLDSSDSSSNSAPSSGDEKKKPKKSKSNKKQKARGKNANKDSGGMEQLLSLLSTGAAKQKPLARDGDNLADPFPPPILPSGGTPTASDIAEQVVQLLKQQEEGPDGKKKAPGKVGSRVAFKRVDQVYDRKIHNYKLKETVNEDPQRDHWDQYVFNVRRQFDTASRYMATFVDIKSKYLRDCLKEVMGEIKGINFVTEKPAVDPNSLFLYLEELRELQDRLTAQSKALEAKKEKKVAKLKSQHLKLLVDYLDEDFADTKKVLYPMLEAGIITFEYLWALFKPNTVLFSSTYADEEEPRAFKTVYSRENANFMKGKWYSIEAKYLDYDGKMFGMGTVHGEVPSFSGARKISSLSCYPIQYHHNPEKTKQDLIDRGKKFVALQGMNYKTYAGMCYTKKEDKVLKVDVNGRMMIDSVIFRKVNPNYPLSSVKPIGGDVIDENVELILDDNGNATTSSDSRGQPTPSSEDFDKHKQFKVIGNAAGELIVVDIDSEEAVQAAMEGGTKDVFTEEQLLIASPTVVGFSFSEKLWLEFAVSKIGEITWNNDAFESLILPDKQKNIVKAMVSSHAFHPSRSIDDIIAGKGKGLVAVLHGGPGLGKTLTVESIADLLKRPLYMVSAGDLGTNSERLERELQNILDIAHAWGAVLLLDEADVFLEKRSTHDIHRNALVSIFLRLLEYFQGILFLTTNRVAVFDDAFVSRIHLSLRYDELSTKARKSIFKTFINKVRDAEGMKVDNIQDSDLDDLSRRALNGRQIKNIIRAAQALAIHEDTPLGLTHIRTVLDVAQTFERDLKGGTGYEAAMASYT